MNKRDYIEEKVGCILFQITFLFVLSIYLLLLNIEWTLVFLLDVVLGIVLLIYFIFDYHKIKKRSRQIHQVIDRLQEKYLASEVLKKPKYLQEEPYYYALQKASKAMNDRISEIEKAKQDYQEYVESFAHEIKTPIAAISLYCDNRKNQVVKEEIAKIDNLVEQILYYARSENTEKDYFVKKIKLDDLLHPILLNYKDHILKNKINLKIHDLEKIVYTDEKWLTFILSQVIQNAIKYMETEPKILEIYSVEKKNQITLTIQDNGIGIKKEELPRIFEKGFTGTNRQKQHSTGIGLYLCKKLCDRLNLKIEVFSQEQVYTKVNIIFPKSSLHKIEEEQ